MSSDQGLVFRSWVGWWQAMRRWHRFEVTGLDNLPRDRAVLIVGYHGRAVAHDLCMLQNVILERDGYLPHPIVHQTLASGSPGRRFADALGFVTGDGAPLRAALEAGEHVIVTPGGTREGFRSFRRRYTVDWGPRTGYLKLALRYGLDVVPVAASGVDDCFLGLNDGYSWGQRLGVPMRAPAWLGVGATGVWPFTLPFPVRVRQHIGAPIQLTADGPVDPSDRVAMGALHARVVSTVQGLLDKARSHR